MTTIMASEDLMGLLELSDEDDNICEILPKKAKTSKPKKHKTSLTNSKSKQNKQRNSLTPSLTYKLNKIKESDKKNTKDIKIKIRKNSKKGHMEKIKKVKRSSKIIPTEPQNHRRKSKRIQTETNSQNNTNHSNTPKNRRKSKRIETEPNNKHKERRKSKQIENKHTNSQPHRRKSKQIQTGNRRNDMNQHRRKSKQIQTNNKHNDMNQHRRKSKRIDVKPENKSNRRKSKRIEVKTENKSSSPCRPRSSSQSNRRKSKRLQTESKSLKNQSKTPEIRRRVSKRIETQSKSLKKPSAKPSKPTTKRENRLRAPAKARKTNEFFVDRPRSKSPQPPISLSPQPPVRPRSKSPQPPIVLSSSPAPVSVLGLRSKSPSPAPSPLAANMEIDFKEMDLNMLYAMYVDIKRCKWNIGSKVEIFSVSQSLWNRGKVTKISRDFQGEYLTVIYNDKQKTLLRGDEHLRAVQIDLCDDRMKEKTIEFIKKNGRYKEEKLQRAKNEMFYVAQKCEIKDPKYGWSWCEILEIFRDAKGEFVTIEYKVYDVMHNDAQYKRYHIPIAFKALKASLPRDVGPVLDHKWKVLLKTNHAYPQQSTCDHMAARNVELGSMGDFYKRYKISFAQHIPDAVCKLIESQNIKIYAILVLDLENTLIPSKLIRSIKKKNDIASSRELFTNFDVWCYDTDYKYLKQLQRIMKQTAETMNTFVNNFRGKIMIYSQGQYVAWNNLINCLSESAGGDLWRDIYKKAVNKNGSDIMSIFACKNVYIQHIEQELDMDDINDIIAAKQLVLEEYFKSIQMGLEYERLKNETYYIPVIFAAGDDKSDQIAVSQAVHGVFQNFYRLVNFELVRNKQKIGDKTLSDNILRQSLFDTMNHPHIQQFMADNDNDSFKKDTWHGLFGGDMQYMHQLEKI